MWPAVQAAGRFLQLASSNAASLPEWGVLPYLGYIGMYGPKGYGFSAVLIKNRVSILADFGHFGHFDMSIILRRSHFFIILEKKIHKSPSQIMFMVI